MTTKFPCGTYSGMKLSDYVSDHGAVTALAEKIRVKHSTVSRWATGSRTVPVERILEIERATGGMVTRKELRPDLAGLFDCKCKRRAAA